MKSREMLVLAGTLGGRHVKDIGIVEYRRMIEG